ncbi:MAG: glycosyltransferase [Pseudanabaenaceae cyanobacterium]
MPLFLILLYQVPFTLILLQRLATGRNRLPPLAPKFRSDPLSVSVVIPTLNEVERLPTCLSNLQTEPVQEVLVVDSNSQDGTRELVSTLAESYPIPLKLITDPPLPKGWVGRPWALHHGFLHSHPQAKWILGLDADTIPQGGMVASLVHTAERDNYDLITISPRFILKSIGEQLLQPSLLVTLIYRFGATGDPAQFQRDRVMANGQCMLIKRELLAKIGGYTCAKGSFCDDVTLVRYCAQQGAKVGFLDGKNILQIRMYTSGLETWREWGRSLDLKDASTPAQLWMDCLLLLAVQGLPLPLLLLLLFTQETSLFGALLLGWNGILFLLRYLVQIVIRDSYTEVGIWFWLAPCSDPFAVFRIWLSALTRPQQWRGRDYSKPAQEDQMLDS